VPAELDALRAETKASYGWRRDGQAISQARYDQLPENQRSDCRWQPDPVVVERLTAAEAAETATQVGWVEAAADGGQASTEAPRPV
jgi:hypothetical protein